MQLNLPDKQKPTVANHFSICTRPKFALTNRTEWNLFLFFRVIKLYKGYILYYEDHNCIDYTV